MCRVLILDDDKFVGETIKIILEEAKEATSDITTNVDEATKRVQQAVKRGRPYEIFLIDQRLGKGKDGITAMQELKHMSPDTDAIVFTGWEDHENGVRAYEAGAFRYLSKPFENRELLFLLKELKRWRKEQREHNWQKVFGSMMEESLSRGNFSDVANIVVKYSLQLGFSRAHLFWVPQKEEVNPDNDMVGITCAGNGCIPKFGTLESRRILYPLWQWFDLNKVRQAHNVIFLRHADAEKIQKQAENYGYDWPTGETIILPLWSGTRLLGALMLDHGKQQRSLSDHERILLDLFARQVSLALENARLYDWEKRSHEETEIIKSIGQHVTNKAAEDDLDNLLEEVRKQIGKLMDTSNFAFVLIDEETNQIDFRVVYKNNERLEPYRKPINYGLEGHLINQHKGDIYLPNNVQQFVHKHKIKMEEQTPSSWLGAPLMVTDRVVGTIVVRNFEDEEKFTQRDQFLLSSVANQIAGDIELSRMREAEKRDTERLNVLRRASAEMLRVAQKDQENLWIIVIALATASFGTCFNRALLFLESDDHNSLILKTAVGTEDPEKARRDWERDEQRHYIFDDFLYDLENGIISPTDFTSLAGKISIPLKGFATDTINEVRKTGQMIVIDENDISAKLPSELTSKVNLSKCAVLPLQAGSRNIGIMVVDNKHNQMKISSQHLLRLQTILAYAGLVWETLQQQRKTESLLDANYQIMGGTSKETLKQTLKRICQTARTISEADWVIIYPLQEGTERFDKKNLAHDGILRFPLEGKVEKARKRGVSSYLLEHHELVVRDISSDETFIDTYKLSEHHFIQSEGVQALIGIAITDVLTGGALGMLYLDYREPRAFSDLDIHHARSFASLAAVAIANAHRFDEEQQHKRLKAAQSTAEIVNKAIDQDEMLRQVLENLRGLFKGAMMCVLTYDEDEQTLRFSPATLRFYRAAAIKTTEELNFPLNGPSIACKVARDSLKRKKSITINVPDIANNTDYLKLIPTSRSELCVGLMDNEKRLLGVLALERPNTHGFSQEDESLVETVAFQLSLGLERARQNDQLNFKRTVATMTAWAADIAHDIKNEVGAIKMSAYYIREYANTREEILESVKEIEKSAETLSQADPNASRKKQRIQLDTLIKRFAYPLAQDRSISLECQLEAGDSEIEVNPIAMKRVLRHLIRNADKAMQNKQEKKILIRTAQPDPNNVEIHFQDFGSGVSDSVQSSLFWKSITTKNSKEGGGHGLVFTRQLVEDMDGTIRLLRSEPGKGATFVIKIPIAHLDDTL